MGGKGLLLGVEMFLEPRPADRGYWTSAGTVRVPRNAETRLGLQDGPAELHFMERTWYALCNAECVCG